MSARPVPRSRLSLTVAQAADHLGVSISTVRRWSDAGHLPAARTPGGQRRFAVEELDRFLDALGVERIDVLRAPRAPGA